MKKLSVLLPLLLSCTGAPDDPRYEACANADDMLLHMEGSGELADLVLSGPSPDPSVIMAGDFLRAARVSDPASFEFEARYQSMGETELVPGLYATGEGALLDLAVQVWAEDRHFEGSGFFELGAERPNWLAIFHLEDITEGYASNATEVEGSIDGCIRVRSPFARETFRPWRRQDDEE